MTTSLPSLFRFHSLDRFPGLLHAISTRRGGLSQGPFASLNLGWTVGDNRADVEANYQRLASALGVRRDHLTTTWQVHGSTILRARATDRGTMIGKADGIVTDQPGLPLTQRYADCTPVVVYDPHRHAAGLVHAGWRGTLAGVASALIRTMVEEFGSDPGDLIAAIGPAIGPCCYEVGPEVSDEVRRAFPNAPSLLIAPPSGQGQSDKGEAWRSNGGPNGLLHLDLWEANRWQMAQAGVTQVEVAKVCTRCQRDTFFSHRGDHGRTGRFSGVVMLRR